MKKRHLYLIGFMLVLAAILLPEIQHLLSLDMNDQVTMLMAAGPAFAPLKWGKGKNNMGGFKPCLLFIPEEACSSVPQLPDPEKATDNDSLVTAEGSFTFRADDVLKQPIYLYSTDGTVDYKADPQGELDGISYKQTLGYFFPGNTPSMHAFNALVKNTPGYYVFEDTDGRQMMLGQPGLPAATSPAFSGGKAHGDRRGSTYTATADSNYTGVFLKTPIDMAVVGGFKPAPENPTT